MTLYDKRIPIKGKFVKETAGYREADDQEFIRETFNIKCPVKEDCMANQYRVQGFKMALLELNYNVNKFAGDALVATGEGVKNG